MAKDRDVVFIRKGGRIIPIKRRKQHRKKAGQAFLGSIGLSTAGTGAALGLLATGTATTESTQKRLKKYQAFVKQSRGKSILFRAANPLMPGAAVDIAKRKIYTGVRWRSDDILHELGHLKQAERKYSFNRFLRNQAQALNRERGIRRGVRALGVAFVRPFTDLGSEAEASYEAIRQVKKTEGTRRALKTFKRLAPAYGTYAARAAATALLYKAGYHYLKSKQKRK